ncbi:hypothetical protein Mal64_09370 [Pseudobythopirellula maris]|uniref:Pel9A-like right handed beta-helix region domain-containing protein n=1 Tax=Pseudobythopirellula maris TaxID=2527991 RepID=A0A5C5ZTX9_9BACT|nr:hypothetical protein [Pseudobythopirellula maris]TWT90545.1 hypothetical protein Mal64_09370 [Pseudobythopirellula maris]
MKLHQFFLLGLPWVPCLAVLAVGAASAGEWYVSPTGSDSNPGTLAQPFGSIERGQQAASAGDTVWLRGGE